MFGTGFDDIYMSNECKSDNTNSHINDWSSNSLINQYFFSKNSFNDNLYLYNDSLLPIILENTTSINYKNLYIEEQVKDLPYTGYILNGIIDQVSNIKQPISYVKSDTYCLTEMDACDKSIYRKFN